VDVELKKQLGSVRKKTWLLLAIFFVAILFATSHVESDFAREKEARKLLQYISLLEKQTSIYCQRIKKLERERNICTLP
jgi:thioredoxin-related protein